MIVIKLSGKALSDEGALKELFNAIYEQELKTLVVHGGGVEVDQILKALDFKSEKLDGIRVSPAEQMPYITGVLAGQCNKQLQGVALASGINAFGMLCTDFGLCSLQPYPEHYGQVAHCSGNDTNVVTTLLEQGYTPVICSIGLDQSSGKMYNVNADEVAAALAMSFKCPLVFFSDVKGVLDQNKEVIPEIDTHKCTTLIEQGVITEGMAVKIKNALEVAHNSGAPVFIASIFDPIARSHLSQLRRIGTTVRA